MKKSIVDLKGQNVVAVSGIVAAGVVLVMVFVFWIKVAGQGLSDFVLAMPLVTGAVGVFVITIAFFLVWRHEDTFIRGYCEVQAENWHDVACRVINCKEFTNHLRFLAGNPRNIDFQLQMEDWIAVVINACSWLFAMGEFHKVCLVVDRLEEMFKGAWSRRKDKDQSDDTIWLEVHNLILARLLNLRESARKQIALRGQIKAAGGNW